LKMATLNGAKALGLGAITGSLSQGKAADITAIDLNKIETQPVYHAVSQIVYSSSRHHVTDVWVQGKHLLNNRKLTALDEKQLQQKAREWGEKIWLQVEK